MQNPFVQVSFTLKDTTSLVYVVGIEKFVAEGLTPYSNYDVTLSRIPLNIHTGRLEGYYSEKTMTKVVMMEDGELSR